MDEVVQQIVGEIAVKETAEYRGTESAQRPREDKVERDGDRQRHAERHHPAPRIIRIGVMHAVHQIGEGDLQPGSRRVVK